MRDDGQGCLGMYYSIIHSQYLWTAQLEHPGNQLVYDEPPWSWSIFMPVFLDKRELDLHPTFMRGGGGQRSVVSRLRYSEV